MAGSRPFRIAPGCCREPGRNGMQGGTMLYCGDGA